LKNLVVYITPKLEENNFTTDLILSLKDSGTDKIELGVPFSDPCADGKIIEKANFKALKNNFKLQDIFDITKSINNKIDIFWMGYFNSFYNKGKIDTILKIAKNLNVKGFIIPDLPFEEYYLYKSDFENNSINNISFITPLTNRDRVKTLLDNSKEFIYLVAYAGVTGSSKNEDLSLIIENIREYSNTKLFLGFGINRENAKIKSKNVDGVIVGSEFVKILLKDSITQTQKIKDITNLARDIKNEINS
jgi:tryptophan synthase alpha chain